jgi:signal recognition particle GTPase
MGAADPVKIAIVSIKHANDNGNELLCLTLRAVAHRRKPDDELKNIKAKVHPTKSCLWFDAMTGQVCGKCGQGFDDALGIDTSSLPSLTATQGAALPCR